LYVFHNAIKENRPALPFGRESGYIQWRHQPPPELSHSRSILQAKLIENCRLDIAAMSHKVDHGD
jgi:hypothetical protein